MGLFDFAKKTSEAGSQPKPGPGEKLVVFKELGMH